MQGFQGEGHGSLPGSDEPDWFDPARYNWLLVLTILNYNTGWWLSHPSEK